MLAKVSELWESASIFFQKSQQSGGLLQFLDRGGGRGHVTHIKKLFLFLEMLSQTQRHMQREGTGNAVFTVKLQ